MLGILRLWSKTHGGSAQQVTGWAENPSGTLVAVGAFLLSCGYNLARLPFVYLSPHYLHRLRGPDGQAQIAFAAPHHLDHDIVTDHHILSWFAA